MSEHFNCGTFKDPSEFPPDIRAMMDKDRAEVEREWTAEDRAELTALRAENARLARDLAEANMAIAMRWPSGESRSPAGGSNPSGETNQHEENHGPSAQVQLAEERSQAQGTSSHRTDERRSEEGPPLEDAGARRPLHMVQDTPQPGIGDDRAHGATVEGRHEQGREPSPSVRVLQSREGQRAPKSEHQAEVLAPSPAAGSARVIAEKHAAMTANHLTGHVNVTGGTMVCMCRACLADRLESDIKALLAPPAPVAVTRAMVDEAWKVCIADEREWREVMVEALNARLSAPASAEALERDLDRDWMAFVATEQPAAQYLSFKSGYRAALASIGIATEGT